MVHTIPMADPIPMVDPIPTVDPKPMVDPMPMVDPIPMVDPEYVDFILVIAISILYWAITISTLVHRAMVYVYNTDVPCSTRSLTTSTADLLTAISSTVKPSLLLPFKSTLFSWMSARTFSASFLAHAKARSVHAGSSVSTRPVSRRQSRWGSGTVDVPKPH